jgi:hypothetical protein
MYWTPVRPVMRGNFYKTKSTFYMAFTTDSPYFFLFLIFNTIHQNNYLNIVITEPGCITSGSKAQISFMLYQMVQVKHSNPITGLDRPIEFQQVEAPKFQDNRYMKVVRLSALRTGHRYPPGIIPGTHFC